MRARRGRVRVPAAAGRKGRETEMLERSYQTRQGTIRYWVSAPGPRGTALVFLPGLTADHRLFQMQFSFFASRRPLLVWDTPGHGASRPFALDFSLMEQAEWLHGILVRERMGGPVLIGQSMGGYLAQCFMERFPGQARGLSPLIPPRFNGGMSRRQSSGHCGAASCSTAVTPGAYCGKPEPEGARRQPRGRR